MAGLLHVKGGVCLVVETTPICNWEGLWKPSDAREEVVFPSANFPYRRIGAVDVGWGVL